MSPRPSHRSPFVRSRLLLVVAIVAAIGGTGLLGAPATALVVDGSRATLGWAPAPGDVLEYGVWVVGPEDTASGPPTLRVPGPQVSIPGEPGTSVRVVVAPFYAQGVRGPASPPSDILHFRAPSAAPFDLDGSGTVDLIVREGETSQHRALLLGPGLPDGASASRLPSVGDEAWRVSGSSDFDDDGSADLLLSHVPTGSAEIWFMEADERRERAPVAAMGAGWYARALGDKEPDGTSRVVWHDQEGGTTELWLLEGARLRGQLTLLPMSGEWEIWATCDVDGNGFRDVLWLDRPGGRERRREARLWLMDAGGAVTEQRIEPPGAGYRIAACGAIDERGRETVVWTDDWQLALWRYAESVGEPPRATVRTLEGARGGFAVGQAGDADGDGDADLMLWHAALGRISLWLTQDGKVTEQLETDLGQRGRWEIASW